METIDYKSKRFLIIDSIKPSHDILKKFAMSLTNQQVDSTLYVQDVVSMCLEKHYDVILLGYDLGEDKKNGQQVLEELRVCDVISRHCVVIIITAEISQAMVLAAIEHKPDDYLCKPYTLHELQNRLNKCMIKKANMAAIYQAIDNGNRSLSINLINSALKDKTPYKTECLGIKSRQFFELNEFEQATEIYTTYKGEVNCQWACIGLGKIALRKKAYSDAERIFKGIIEEHPLYLPSYDWLATTYEKQGNDLEAEAILAIAIKLSPRSVARVEKYAQLCFLNENYEKATQAYLQVYHLAFNSIHQSPNNVLMFAEALINHSSNLSKLDAKKMNNTAFSMMSQMNKNYQQTSLKIETHLISASLLENVQEYMIAKNKLAAGLKLLEREQSNIDNESLKNIAYSLKRLNINDKATQILTSVHMQQNNKDNQSIKVGDLSTEQLNDHHTEKAQKALRFSKDLFDAKDYTKAIEYLNEALLIFPNHIGIKLNLLQVLLTAYDEDKTKAEELAQAKKITLRLLSLDKKNEHYLRFKKMKKKYQQLAGI